MSWSNRIHDEIAARRQEARDIWGAIMEAFKPTPKDPKRLAKEPPKNWHGTQPAEVPDTHDVILAREAGGINTYDENGLRHVASGATTVAEQRMERQAKVSETITPQEQGEMLVYRVSDTQVGLHNLTLAAAIKRHWKEGKKPRIIGVLVGCSESTARHYCICFERAQKSSNATPLF